MTRAKDDYRRLDPLPDGVVVLRPTTLAKGAALVECHHAERNLQQRGGGYKGVICGVCRATDLSRYVKLIAYVPADSGAQEALF